jgi:hypothetical protein
MVPFSHAHRVAFRKQSDLYVYFKILTPEDGRRHMEYINVIVLTVIMFNT